MKLITLTIAVFVLAGGLVLPAASRADDTLAKIAVGILAEKFKVDPRVTDVLLHRSDKEVFEAAPAFAVSYHARRPIDEVWKLREEGLGWGQIAHRLGMNPGQFNKLRKSGAFDRDHIWESALKERYGARDGDLSSIRKQGGSLMDALRVFAIAHESGSRPGAVFSRYQKERDWERTASAFKVNLHEREPAESRASSRAKDDSWEEAEQAGRGRARKEADDDDIQAQPGHGRGQTRGQDNDQDGEGPGKGRGRGRRTR